MWKKILFLGLLTLATSLAWTQGLNAKTWPPGSKIPADSMIAVIERGEDVVIQRCEIIGRLRKGPRGWRGLRTGHRYKLQQKLRTLTLKRQLREVDFLEFPSEETWAPDTVEGTIRIIDCSFSDGIEFGYCHFKEPVSLLGNTFNDDVSFWGATFSKHSDFSLSRYKHSAYFIDTDFVSGADFMMSVFCGYTDFENTSFGKEADFIGVRFEGTVALGLRQFENTFVRWEQLEGHLAYDPAVNYRLMKHFEENRLLHDEDGIYLFLKDQERIRKPLLERYIEYWLIQFTCGYGVRPERVLLLSILIILGFTFFYARPDALTEIQERLRFSRRRKMLRRIHRTLRKRLYDAFYFSFQTFIIGVVPDWHPTDNCLIHTRKVKLFRFKTLAMIEGALGWILLVLFVVTLTRKFIR